MTPCSERVFGSWFPSDADAKPSVVPEPEPQSPTCGGTAHFLPAERARASFDVLKLTHLLDGGEKQTARRRWLWKAGEAWDNSKNMFRSRSQVVEDHVSRFVGLHHSYANKGFIPRPGDVGHMVNGARNQGGTPPLLQYSGSWGTTEGRSSRGAKQQQPGHTRIEAHAYLCTILAEIATRDLSSPLAGAFGLHYGAFVPTLMSQCTDEQKAIWLPRAFTMKVQHMTANVSVFC